MSSHEIITEQKDSNAISSTGGRGMGTRTFNCLGYPTIDGVFYTIGKTVSGTAVPAKFDPHPNLPGLVATDFSIEPVADGIEHWKMIWQYEVIAPTFGSGPFGASNILPNEVGYVEVSSNIRAEFVPAWRSGKLSYPSEGQPDDDEQEVGGVPIDRGGNPVSVQRNIQELTVTETVNSPDWSTYRSYRFNRNSKEFQGAPAGRVLYKGTSLSRTGVNVYQVSHFFVEDLDYHLQMHPAVDQEGNAIDKDGDGHADFVYWIQPFGDLANFGNISGNF